MRLNFEKLAALGALAATGGIVLVYALFFWIGTPRPETAGMDATSGNVLRISVGIAVLALVALHLAIAHQLWYAPVDTPRQ